MDWQSIDSAPKDGTEVDIWAVETEARDGPVEHGVRFVDCEWTPAGWKYEKDGYPRFVGDNDHIPTHWMIVIPPSADPGIPVHPTALVEKGIPGLATIHDATDDVLGKDGG